MTKRSHRTVPLFQTRSYIVCEGRPNLLLQGGYPKLNMFAHWKLPKPNKKGSSSNHHVSKGELLNFGGVVDILAYYCLCWCLSQQSMVFGQIVMFHELWIDCFEIKTNLGEGVPYYPTFLGWGRMMLCQIIWSNSPQMSADHKTRMLIDEWFYT